MVLASMFVGVLPLTMGVVYAIWPNEQRLSLMRTLSLATVFASVGGLALGLINLPRFVGRPGTAGVHRAVAIGPADTLGMWRRP